MKLLKNPTYYLFFLLVGLSFSCKQDQSQEFLHRAQYNLAMNKVGMAINLLDSIRNPENMDIDSYMRYIVTYTGAKYEEGKDITGDTLIFRAQRYFTDKGNIQDRVLSNFYAAQLYNIYKLYPQALESFMYAINEAKESGNELFVGRSYNNIGYIYFKQQLYDSAVVNYQKALQHYSKVENVDQNKIKTLTNIGRAYEVLNQLDSACISFDKCLSLAKEINNETYQFYSLKNLGVVCYGMKDYNKAIEYFQIALAMNEPEESDLFQIHLYLLNIYNKKKNLETAKQYADLVMASLPSVTNLHTIKEMYASLSEYYKQAGDYKEALEYSNLEKVTKDQIEIEADVPAIFQANNNFYLTQKEREAHEFISLVLYIAMLVFVVLVAITLFAIYAYSEHKKDKSEIQIHRDKFSELRKILASLRSDYPQIKAEIKAMQEDVENEEEEK